MVNVNRENLGPAERIINSVLTYTDHLYHGRPGIVVTDARTNVGVRWEAVTHKIEDINGVKRKVVYRLSKVGKKTIKTKVGVVTEAVAAGGHVIQHVRTDASPNHPILGEYREAGLFPEVATWMYRQVAEVWKLDNEFAAKWASYAFAQEHRDLKVVLAAFMLVQSRKGDPVRDGGAVAFYDDDFRDIGEAMTLIRRKDDKDLNPKLLLRIRSVLALPEIAAINNELGFGVSTRKPAFGRWPKVVEKWLRHREENPKLLESGVRAGFRKTIIKLAKHVGYKPETVKFFETLRWKQAQANDGRRQLMIGVDLAKVESWAELTEMQICERIVKEKPDWKRLVGMLPKGNITRAVVAAAVEAKALSERDLIIATPTLEELGLLDVPAIKAAWEKAIQNADNSRAANIAKNVNAKAVKDKLVEAADTAIKKAVEEVVKNIRVYFMVDISGSMKNAIEAAKGHIAKFLQGFPVDKTHVAVFNTTGREITLKHASAVGVENAFRGITAGGGTDYGAGVRALMHHKPKDDEDVLFIFVGDEEAHAFDGQITASGLKPLAFGFVKTVPDGGAAGYRHAQFGGENNIAVRETAKRLGVPCFMIDEKTFDDVYAIPRTIRNLIAATPVGPAARAVAAPRMTFVDQILKTELLRKPVWA
jgi:hypothetical protein